MTKSTIGNRKLSEVLPYLFCSKSADAIQAEAEHDPIFLSKTDIERRKLRSDRATIPSMAERYSGTD